MSAQSDQIVPSLSIEALLMKREAARACLERIAAAVAEYKQLGTAVGQGYESASHVTRAPHKWGEALSSRDYSKTIDCDGWLEWAQKNLDASLWEHLLSLSGIRTYMDGEAKKDWDKAIDQNQTPELTEPTIRATFAALHNKRNDFFERGVLKLFRSLSWCYKSNKPQKFGKRIIVTYLAGNGKWFTLPSYERCNELDDLIRAFCILDKKPEPDHRMGTYSHLSAAHHAGSTEWDGEYVRIKMFKNGNGHVYLKDQALVEQLNRILHKHHPDALPAEAA